MKSKSTVRPQTVTTPENVVRVSVPIQKSPKCSALKHTAALGLSERGERRILHRHPQMQPYKIMVTEELSEKDFETYTVCEGILQNVPRDTVLLLGCRKPKVTSLTHTQSLC